MEEASVSENSIFKKVDQFLFEQMATLKKSPFVDKISETVRSLPEEKQILLNQLSNILILFIPLVIFLVFFVIAMISGAELNEQKEINRIMTQVKTNEGKLSRLSNALTAKSVVENKRTFVDDLNKILERRDFPIKKLTIDNYDDGIRGSDIKMIRAELKFDSIANKSLKTLLLEIQSKFKAKITNLSVNKDTKTSRLTGAISIEFLSKAF